MFAERRTYTFIDAQILTGSLLIISFDFQNKIITNVYEPQLMSRSF